MGDITRLTQKCSSCAVQYPTTRKKPRRSFPKNLNEKKGNYYYYKVQLLDFLFPSLLRESGDVSFNQMKRKEKEASSIQEQFPVSDPPLINLPQGSPGPPIFGYPIRNNSSAAHNNFPNTQ